MLRNALLGLLGSSRVVRRHSGRSQYPRNALMALLSCSLLLACTPTVRIEAPDKPIEINMNINIKHEILVKVEKEVQQLFDEDKGLF